MKRRLPPRSVRWTTTLGCAAIALVSRPAAAQPCEDERVTIQGSLREGWADAAQALCKLLHELPDADSNASLTLRPAGRDLITTVSLGDGRVTSRRLHEPSELLPTVEALMVVPPSSLDDREPMPDEAPRFARDDEVPSAPAPAGELRAKRVSFELGASLMGRTEGSPTYLSLGVQGFAALRVWSFTLALAARWDGFQSVVRERPPHLEMSTEGGGLWVLYRFVQRATLAVDAGLSLWVLAVMQTHSEGADERGGTVADVRSGPLVRALFGAGPWRTTVGLDLELSRRRLRDDLRLDRDLPTLPAWGVGLTFGLAWSTG